LQNVEVALSYYRKSIAKALQLNTLPDLGAAYYALANLYIQRSSLDSANLYAHKAMVIAQQVKSKPMIIEAAKQLSLLKENKNDREALLYYKLATALEDSIFNEQSKAQVQGMTFTEQERKREQDETNAKAAEERKHNLQYAVIALGLVGFVILFLLLSHSIVANQKLIKFLGVLSLLIIFEFLNLLLHPYLGALTHHQPFLMLGAMVCIAALLIPLHHKLEHWVTQKLVAKNSKIRLAAAKKTIQQLEGKVTTTPLEKSTDTQN
jgi:tetratricopeptide (TPR) repeat protein